MPTNKFFELLRYSIGTSNAVPQMTEEEWQAVYELAKKQSLVGVAFMGVSRLPVELRPPKQIMLNWYVLTEKIAKRNLVIDKVAVAVVSQFAKAGYPNCILKGTGNALMYPQPSARTSGDIDLWVKGDIKKLVLMARKRVPSAKACYHHVDFGKVGGIELELHYRPSFMNNLINNHRLQQWFTRMEEEQFQHQVELSDGVGAVCVPTVDFNIVYQMVHISNHIVHEGIGLRQLLDYYYLLLMSRKDGRCKMSDVRCTLRQVGLYKVASAVMYVLHEVFGLKQEQMIVPMDEKRGRFLLNEIMIAGNFGHYDERVKHDGSAWQKNMQRLKRDLRLLRYFPSECLWEPVFRWFHFFWRLRHK